MKKFNILLLICVALCFASCRGDSDEKTSGLTIKGTFSDGTHAKLNLFERFLNFFSTPVHALDPSSVAKVIVISAGDPWCCNNNGVYVSDVKNGNFSIGGIQTDMAVGMIFANAANGFLGYLTMSNGLNSLPLNQLEDGTSVIDLETLSSAGLIVEPAHDPIGNEIQLTDTEIAIINQVSGMFSLIMKNPDADGDGQVDLLQGVRYSPYLVYTVTAGTFEGENLTPTVSSPLTLSDPQFQFTVFEPTATTFPDYVYITGPSGSGLNNTESNYKMDGFCSGMLCGYNCGSVVLNYAAGNYSVTYGTKTLTFSIPDQSGANESLILIMPEVVLNIDGTINKISWTYQAPDGSTDFDPLALIDVEQKISIQLNGSGDCCEGWSGGGAQIYSSYNTIEVPEQEHVLHCQNILWSNVDSISFTYNDIYKNIYFIRFNH